MSTITTSSLLISVPQNNLVIKDLEQFVHFTTLFFQQWNLLQNSDAISTLLTSLSTHKASSELTVRFEGYKVFWSYFYDELQKKINCYSKRLEMITRIFDECMNLNQQESSVIQIALVLALKDGVNDIDFFDPNIVFYSKLLRLFWARQWREVCNLFSDPSKFFNEFYLQCWLIAEIESFKTNTPLNDLASWKRLDLPPPVASILKSLITGVLVKEEEVGYGYAKGCYPIIWNYAYYRHCQYSKCKNHDLILYEIWAAAKVQEIFGAQTTASAVPEKSNTIASTATTNLKRNEHPISTQIVKRPKPSPVISRAPIAINLVQITPEEPQNNPFISLLKHFKFDNTLNNTLQKLFDQELLEKFSQLVDESRIKVEQASTQQEFANIFTKDFIGTFVTYLKSLKKRPLIYSEALAQLRFFPAGWMIYLEHYLNWPEKKGAKNVIESIRDKGWKNMLFHIEKELALIGMALKREDWANLTSENRIKQLNIWINNTPKVAELREHLNLFTATPQAFGACCSSEQIESLRKKMPILYGAAYYSQPNNSFLVTPPLFHINFCLVSIQEYREQLKKRGWSDLAELCESVQLKL